MAGGAICCNEGRVILVFATRVLPRKGPLRPDELAISNTRMFRARSGEAPKETKENKTSALQTIGSFFGRRKSDKKSCKSCKSVDDRINSAPPVTESRPTADRTDSCSALSVSTTARQSVRPVSSLSDTHRSEYERGGVRAPLQRLHDTFDHNVFAVPVSRNESDTNLDEIMLYSQPSATRHDMTEELALDRVKSIEQQEKARNATHLMQEAFAKELSKKRDSRHNRNAKHTTKRYRLGQSVSFETLLKAEAQLAVSKSSPQRRSSRADTAQMDEGAQSPRPDQVIPVERPSGLVRSTSLFNVRCSKSQMRDEEIYDRRVLPEKPVPFYSNHWINTSLPVSKSQARKEALHSQSMPSPTPGVSGRRSSCPPMREKPPASSLESKRTDASAHSSTVDHVFGAVIFFYWLANGRKFSDPNVSLILRQPQTQCLSIGLPIINFEREFPLATLTIYRNPANASMQDIPKYCELPYADATFDVVSANVLTTVVLAKDWKRTLLELKRVLKPGGHLELMGFSSSWVNAGPKSAQQEQIFRDGLDASGFHGDIMSGLPPIFLSCDFASVKVAHLAMPVSWGVSTYHVPRDDNFLDLADTFFLGAGSGRLGKVL